jgi:hypothetical protein
VFRVLQKDDSDGRSKRRLDITEEVVQEGSERRRKKILETRGDGHMFDNVCVMSVSDHSREHQRGGVPAGLGRKDYISSIVRKPRTSTQPSRCRTFNVAD